MIKLTSKTLLLTGCLLASSAHASLIDSSLTITGNAILDTTDATLALSSNTYSANMYSVVGGTNTGGDANAVQLTSIGDGFGHSGSLSGNHTLVSTLGGDYDFSIQNSSADDFLVTFGITFYHQADADDNGTAQDARARSRLDVVEGSTEHLYSDLQSMSGKDYYDAGNPEWQDTTWDELSFDPTPLGTWGDLLSFGETRYFDISIAALTTETFDAEFTLTGQIWDALGSYASQSQMFIFVDGVENKTSGGSNPNPNPIPEPSSIALFALAALGLFGRKIKA